MSRIPIVLVRIASDIGGVESQVLGLAAALRDDRDFEPIVVCGSTGRLTSRLEQERIPYRVIPALSHKNPFSAARELMSVIPARTPMLIQSHGFRESLICRAAKRRNPQVVHVYRVHTHIDSGRRCAMLKFAYHVLDGASSRYVDLFAANGRYLSLELTRRSWIPESKIRVIYDGRPSLGPPDEVQSDDRPLPLRIAVVARIDPYKGFETLVAAVKILARKGVSVGVRVIGEPIDEDGVSGVAYFESLRKIIRDALVVENFEFFGHLSDVYSAIRDCAVLALPSLSEGIPNSVIEGMALKKLVIVSRVGGVPEMIESERSGLLHPAGDYRALASLLERVASSPSREFSSMRKNAHAAWARRFSVERMVAELRREYANLLGSGAAYVADVHGVVRK